MKLLGAACVMLATIGYSGYLLEKQKLHRDVLQSLVSMAELLAGYIGYERLTMEEALLRLSGSCRYVSKDGVPPGGASGAPLGGSNGAPLGGSNGAPPGLLYHVLTRMADRLAAGTDGSFELVWREEFQQEAPRMLLREEELAIVLEMGKNLGGADIKTQVKRLQGGARRLEKKYAEAGRELAEKRRLYRYLGVAIGAMAAFVLI